MQMEIVKHVQVLVQVAMVHNVWVAKLVTWTMDFAKIAQLAVMNAPVILFVPVVNLPTH